MTSEQLAILNSLVTFAAEHIPGGLSVDEREVAQIVGGWALKGERTVTKSYRPVFSGETEKGEKIVLYRGHEHTHDFHICIDDEELKAIPLNGSSDVTWWSDSLTGTMHIQIVSAVWSGTATGTYHDLREAEAR